MARHKLSVSLGVMLLKRVKKNDTVLSCLNYLDFLELLLVSFHVNMRHLISTRCMVNTKSQLIYRQVWSMVISLNGDYVLFRNGSLYTRMNFLRIGN